MPELTADEWTQKIAALGYPPESHAEAIRAAREYPQGIESIAPFAKTLRPDRLYHAAYAAEKYSKDSVERVVSTLVPENELDGLDILHAAASDKQNGFEATEIAVKLGWRKTDIGHAAQSVKLWPSPAMGRDALQRMRKLLQRVRADVMEEDIRHCAMTLRNLNEDLLERALRDRHPRNERDPWVRGLSIQLVAWAYKLSPPHTGQALDDCRSRNARRESVGQDVLAFLSRRFGRPVNPPPWLGGGKA